MKKESALKLRLGKMDFEKPSPAGVFFLKNFALLSQAWQLGAVHFLMLGYLAIQWQQRNFINTEVWLPVFGALGVSFLVHSAYVLVVQFRRFNALKPVLGHGVFFVDALVLALLMYFTTLGVGGGLYVLLMLVNVFFYGLLHGKRSMHLALFSGICYSGALVLGELSGWWFYAGLVINNVGFLGVGALSAALSVSQQALNVARLRSEKQALELKRINDLVLKSAGAGIVTTDIWGVVVSCNAAASKILETSLVGEKLTTILPDLWGEVEVEPLLQSVKNTQIADLSYMTPSGKTWRSLNIVGATIWEGGSKESGRAMGRVFVLNDITEQKRLAQEAYRNERLASVGQMAAQLAHEIRNPLTSMQGGVELIAAAPHLKQAMSQQEQGLVGIILKEIARLNNLLTELLDFAKPNQFQFEPVDLGQILRECSDLAKAEAKGWQVELNLKHTSRVKANPEKLKQAFLNIIKNAQQATLESMRKHKKAPVSSEEIAAVAYASRAELGDYCIKIETCNTPQGVQVLLQDYADGMTKEQVKKAFEPFCTTKSKGTGLGLPISLKIIEAHGGGINIKSQPGKGTVVEVNLAKEPKVRFFPLKKGQP